MTLTTNRYTIGDTIEFPWRPWRSVTINPRVTEVLARLRAATIIAARFRSTITYKDAELAIDHLYPARGLAQLLDLLSYDCEARGEPSLAALVVNTGTGEVGRGFGGDPEQARQACYRHWQG